MTDRPQPISSHTLNWKIAGKAGEGVMTTSDTFAKACHRHGMNIFNYYEYPSLIKGGHQTGQVHASFSDVYAQKKILDVLIALDEAGISQHQEEISSTTWVIAEPTTDKYDIAKYSTLTSHILEIPLTNIAREVTQSSIAANMVALGVSAYLLGLNSSIFETLIKEEFQHKGDDIVVKNISAFQAGFQAVQAKVEPVPQLPIHPSEKLMMNGGEAIGSGALAAGLQFYSAYPMSPSSNTFHFIAAQQDKYPLVVRHAEDEISAINLAVGASYAGVRAMTGTAGGGFALMVETLSLTGVMEVPLVILVAQRPGPATGLPTWTSQSDLQFVLRAGHGEFQRVVLTPGTVSEHFEMTQQAFFLAEKYQIPVIILSDKYLLESHQSITKRENSYSVKRESIALEEHLLPDDSYRRYHITDSGISPRSVPGQPHGLHLTNSYEHDEFGFATEDIQMTVAQVEKRARKNKQLLEDIPQPIVFGPQAAELTFICWGSTVNVLLQAQSEKASQKSIHWNIIHVPCVWPFPTSKMQELLKQTKNAVIIEGNHTGQFEQLIQQEIGFTFTERIRRFDGRPFYPEDVWEYINQR